MKGADAFGHTQLAYSPAGCLALLAWLVSTPRSSARSQVAQLILHICVYMLHDACVWDIVNTIVKFLFRHHRPSLFGHQLSKLVWSKRNT